MKKLELYLETSVWNFYYEDSSEKRAVTQQFFHSLPTSPFRIYASDVVIDEINCAAPDKKNQLLQLIDTYQHTMLIMNPAADELVNSYLAPQAEKVVRAIILMAFQSARRIVANGGAIILMTLWSAIRIMAPCHQDLGWGDSQPWRES